jgi:hypothetical protein
VISDFESYIGLTYTDADLTTGAATIEAQTGLSTFVCLASFELILFLAPPTRFFAAARRRTSPCAAGTVTCGNRPDHLTSGVTDGHLRSA